MSSILLSNPRYGTRGEYLAHYLLSGSGTVVQVPRQEDTGVDFHCTIGAPFGLSEKYEEHFYIQLKSSSESIIYGNVEKKGDKVKWKFYELEWLFNLQNPLLIGICNSESESLEIYSTSFMWHRFYTEKNFCQIKLSPNSPSEMGKKIDAIPGSSINNWVEGIGCENVCFEIPLGPPIVILRMEDLKKNSESLKTKRNLIREIVENERKNIIFRQLKVPYFIWPYQIWTNQKINNFYFYASQKLLDDEQELLNNMTPLLLSLGILYNNPPFKAKFEKLKPALDLLDKNMIPIQIKDMLNLW